MRVLSYWAAFIYTFVLVAGLLLIAAAILGLVNTSPAPLPHQQEMTLTPVEGR